MPRLQHTSLCKQNGDSATSLLLRLLTVEIARDGGACLVTRLKEYVKDLHNLSGKRFNALLVESNVGKSKLMTFLENHCTVFDVDRNKEPHWVTLIDPNEKSLSTTDDSNGGNTFLRDILTSDTDIDIDIQMDLKSKAYHKALYVLRKRHARMVRRHEANIAPTRDYNLHDDLGVNDHWLLRQCCWEVHAYLRTTKFYPYVYPTPFHVKVVGSLDWEVIAMPKFHELLSTASGDSSNIEISNDKIRIRHGQVRNGVVDIDTILDEEEIRALTEIDRALTELVVHKDGGHQVSLSLLLHRHPSFRKLLGGRDLWKFYSTCTVGLGLFQNVSMFRLDDDVILRSKRPKTFVTDKSTILEGDGTEEASLQWKKRMKVDEEGLFSVTNRKWGRVMANFLIRACDTTRLFDNDLSSVKQNEKQIRTVIDLTASVGGMTLALAKANYFDRIEAYEIDKTRAALCEQNMREHGYGEVVQVFNKDSVDVVPTLPRNICIVIDPPWGGYNYKKIKKETNGRSMIRLGETSLEDVLERIAHHNAPCLVGLRLPVNFAVDDLLSCLSEARRNVSFNVISIRKIGVQLFVVLHFT
ncbi:RNA cap guanine-N2 methyltransferase [Nitzschia inconspicua]|uniref:RNA cap guanine-N2 methyltransferase n=1 Tax=Nitzschia inconspicua TaxID=303405 RepID=A0A9K3PXP7_9STRA|nr:RNA cap guanine-N2 methyltransferase [Nitzschia inconspicua]